MHISRARLSAHISPYYASAHRAHQCTYVVATLYPFQMNIFHLWLPRPPTLNPQNPVIPRMSDQKQTSMVSCVNSFPAKLFHAPDRDLECQAVRNDEALQVSIPTCVLD